MATGIVSVALALDGRQTLSRIFLVLAAAVWLTVAVLAGARAARDRVGLAADVRTPPALGAVAGTAVIGARLVMLHWNLVAGVLLALAAVLWALLSRPVLAHWRTPTVGASLLVTVATQSLAVLAASLALHTRTVWLVYAALAPFALGLCSYGVVMARFNLRELMTGAGDQWITGGALAISALAAGDIAAGARALRVLGQGHGAIEIVAIALWAASMAWLPALLVAEALHPRVRYEPRRWSMVFPLGMYAACSFVVGDVAHAGAITGFARTWIWVSVAGWTLVCVGAIRSALHALEGDEPYR